MEPPVGYGAPRDNLHEAVPAPGELRIREKRTWKTWQLAVAMGLAVLIGLAINYRTVAATQSPGSSGGAYTLPTQATSTTTTSAGGGSAAGTSTTTTTTTSSTGAGSSPTSSTTTTSTGGSSQARLLLGPTQSQGNWTSPVFTITAPGWDIGWAFRCTVAPTSGPSFQVSVAPAGLTPTGAAAISETGPSGQAVTTQSSTGQQVLVVQAPADCAWAVKVTGS